MADILVAGDDYEQATLHLTVLEYAAGQGGNPPPTTGQIWPRGNWS